MKTILLACALALVACKKKEAPAARPSDAPPPAAAIDAAPPADAADTAEAPPLTPPPPAGKPGIQVKGVEYEGFEAPMLPAVSEDGTRFAAVTVGDDGGRGFLDLTLLIIDGKTGKAVETKVIVDPEESAKAQGEDGAFAQALLDTVKTRVENANALLGASTWRALDSARAADVDPEAPITAAGISWSLDEKLHLIGTRGGKPVFDKTYTQLTGKPAPKSTGADDDDMCPDIIVLSAVHVDAKTQQALVAFGRVSGHNCGAPGDDFAVIALPK